MLKFKDNTGRVKMVLRDEDLEPIDIDNLIMRLAEESSEDKEEDKNKQTTNKESRG